MPVFYNSFVTEVLKEQRKMCVDLGTELPLLALFYHHPQQTNLIFDIFFGEVTYCFTMFRYIFLTVTTSVCIPPQERKL